MTYSLSRERHSPAAQTVREQECKSSRLRYTALSMLAVESLSSLLICPQLSILHREAEYPCSDVAQNNAPGLLFAGSAAMNRGRKTRESVRV
jgi:hypothetical protein